MFAVESGLSLLFDKVGKWWHAPYSMRCVSVTHFSGIVPKEPAMLSASVLGEQSCQPLPHSACASPLPHLTCLRFVAILSQSFRAVLCFTAPTSFVLEHTHSCTSVSMPHAPLQDQVLMAYPLLPMRPQSSRFKLHHCAASKAHIPPPSFSEI